MVAVSFIYGCCRPVAGCDKTTIYNGSATGVHRFCPAGFFSKKVKISAGDCPQYNVPGDAFSEGFDRPSGRLALGLSPR
jgi:hypothetical protein